MRPGIYHHDAYYFFTWIYSHPFYRTRLTNESLSFKNDESETLERVFTAHELDVELREKAIMDWDLLNTKGKTNGPRPEHIQVGDQFVKVDKLPQKAIFWTQGIKIRDDGQKFGKGMLNLELILVDKLGFDLSANPYSLNETIRVIIRTITPFLVLFLIAFFTAPDDKKMLDRFLRK